MAKAKKADSARRKAAARSSGNQWTGWLLLGVVALVAVGGGAYLFLGGSDDAESAANVPADGVQVLAGGTHTVRHSVASLPSASAPRPDGKPTLVWFSGTWCHFCEAMEPFAFATAGERVSRMAFVEKSVDHDRSAARQYGIRGTPTFVLIDSTGRELGRFGYQANPAAFGAAIDGVLGKS